MSKIDVWKEYNNEDKLLVVDVSAVMRTNMVYRDTPENRLAGLYHPIRHRNKQALSIIYDNEEMNTSAMYGLLRIFKTFQLEHNVVFCFDSPTNLRKTINENYKNNRVKQNDEYFDQVNTMYKLLELSRFPVMMVEGLEADDCIYHVVRRYKDDYKHIGILTNDKDLTHLVDETVSWYNVIRTRGDIHFSNYEEVLGIPYNTIVFYKSLVGDNSDNIKGAHGVGKKRFEKIMSTLDPKDVHLNEYDLIGQVGLTDTQVEQARDSLMLVIPRDHNEAINYEIDDDIHWRLFRRFLERFEMMSIVRYVDTFL